MIKRTLSLLLAVLFLVTSLPLTVFAQEAAPASDTVELSNPYIRVTVNKKNGGYVIATTEGDILNKNDNDVDLIHRGGHMDSSFTSLRVGEGDAQKDYIFGNDYGFLGMNSTDVATEVNAAESWIKSTWTLDDHGRKLLVEQKITLIASETSEQLGTAQITYTVKNLSGEALPVKGRILMDTQLGDQDYGYYELPRQYLGQGYEYFRYERAWDKASTNDKNPMPADYFVRDQMDHSKIVAYGVNSVFEDKKPYRMTFAHWANIAATKFDYEPDNGLYFTNDVNSHRTADSAVALYYDAGTIPAGGSSSFSTHYGVTANLKNKDNQVIINTTAPSRLEFTDDSRTAFKSTDPALTGDNVVRINTTITNPLHSNRDFKNLRVVAYAMGLTTQRRNDLMQWTEFKNTDPISIDIAETLHPGDHKVTYFDLKFTPKEAAELGSILLKIYDMDPSVNPDGAYAENFCLATTENFIIIPGQNRELPAISLSSVQPDTLYNDELRYVTVHGRGVSFFQSDLLNKVTLVREDGKFSYELPAESVKNILYGQPENPGDPITSATFQLTGYMEPGRYQMHFHWRKDRSPGQGEEALQGVPEDFTAPGMIVTMSSDPIYKNEHYGIVTVVRDGKDRYKTLAFKSEADLQKSMGDKASQIPSKDFLIICRGPLMRESKDPNRKDKAETYHLAGNEKNVTINGILNCFGSDFSILDDGNGSVSVGMDGLLTSVGANTTLRDGTAAFFLKAGTEYLIPVYNEEGEPVENGGVDHTGQSFLTLKWDNTFDIATFIGGFLIDLRYGVLSKIQNGDGTVSDVISFGGGVDLGFMVPGGTKAARINKAAETKGREWVCIDPRRAPINTKAGEKGNHVLEEEEGKKYSGSAQIYNVLYGGKNPGYLGINMETGVKLPKLLPVLPSDVELALAVNTIGGYQVGLDGQMELSKLNGLEFAVSIVIKGSPNGVPIPDKLYLHVEGLEPGINIDTVGGIWITGIGGGVDNLYDTIYSKDALPPLTLMFHMAFDLAKVVTGKADLELSLQSISISAENLHLKGIKNAKFLDKAGIYLQWLPGFSLKANADINFLEVMQGKLYAGISAGYTSNTDILLEFLFRVGLYVPEAIPVVGGMEIAAAELGGNTEKLWGNVALLETIKVGLVYYWGSNVEFVAGGVGDAQSMAELPSAQLFALMSEPQQVSEDPDTGKAQYVTVGGNLNYVAGSQIVKEFDEYVAAPMRRTLRSTPVQETTVFTNETRDQHLVTLGESTDFILNVARMDGSELTNEALQQALTVTKNGKPYKLHYYVAPDHAASNSEKDQAMAAANVNVTGSGAYILIPREDIQPGTNFLVKFSDGKKYDVGAVRVAPISALTAADAALSGSTLHVNWQGTDLSDTAQLTVNLSDEKGADSGIVLFRGKAAYTGSQGSLNLPFPADLAGGDYYVTVTLSDEGTCYEEIEVPQPVHYTDPLAPAAPAAATLTNTGNYKLQLKVTPPADAARISGYYVDVYEKQADGTLTLVNGGLYFDKNDEMMYVGGRFDREKPVLALDANGEPRKNSDGSPVYEQAVGPDGKPLTDAAGNPVPKTVTETIGFEPGHTYTAKVRAVNLVDPDPEVEGDEISHYSAFINSASAKLNQPNLPELKLSYDLKTKQLKVQSVNGVAVTGELYVNAATQEKTWYEFKDEAVEHVITKALADGEYLLEFHGKNAQGDQVMVQQPILLDTTAPSMLLDSPISGGSYTGNRITVKLECNEKAVYTAKVNGVEATVTSPTMGRRNVVHGGLTELAVTIPEEQRGSTTILLELTATDASKNQTTKQIRLVNGDVTAVKEVKLYADGKPVAENGELTLKENTAVKLSLMGILTDGSTIDLTQQPNVSIELLGGDGVLLENGMLTGVSGGKAAISATLHRGTGVAPLLDGAAVSVNSGKQPMTQITASIDAPAKQTNLDVTVTTDAGCTGAVAWYKGSTTEGQPVIGKAEAGQIYTAKIVLTPAAGETFAESVTVTLNGTATAAVRQADGTLTVTKTFPATENKVLSQLVIRNTDREILVPAAAPGAEAVAELTLTAEAIYDDGSRSTMDCSWKADALPAGVTLTGNKLIVKNTAAISGGSAELHLTAEKNGVKSEAVAFTIRKPQADQADQIRISGPQSIVIPGAGSAEVEFSAKVYNTYGEELTQPVVWSGTGVTGVAVKDGKVTVPAGTEAGEYKLTAKVGKATQTLTISITAKAEAQIQISTKDWTYDGKAKTPEYKVTISDDLAQTGGKYTVTYTGELLNGKAYAESAAAPAEPGFYTVAVRYEDANHLGRQTADFQIGKAEIGFDTTGLKVAQKVYNEDVDAVITGKIQLTGVIGEDQLTAPEAPAKGTFESMTIGADKQVTAMITDSIGGADAWKYQVSEKAKQITLQGEIVKPAGITAMGSGNQVKAAENTAVLENEDVLAEIGKQIPAEAGKMEGYTLKVTGTGDVKVFVPFPEGTDSTFTFTMVKQSANGAETLPVTVDPALGGLFVTLPADSKDAYALAWKDNSQPEPTPEPVPTETPTAKPTDTPTEAPTQAPTEAPAKPSQPQTPPTGDATMLTGWALMALTTLLGALAIGDIKRRNRRS